MIQASHQRRRADLRRSFDEDKQVCNARKALRILCGMAFFVGFFQKLLVSAQDPRRSRMAEKQLASLEAAYKRADAIVAARQAEEVALDEYDSDCIAFVRHI